VGALALLGFGAFVGASLFVGVRLLGRARRTRGAAELAIGASLALAGTGYAVMITAFRLKLVPEAAFQASFALATALLDLGVLALLLGIRQVFRPSARWAATLAVLGAAVLVASWVRGVAGFRPNAERAPFVFWSFNATAVAAHAWCAVECARAQAALRPRVLLGLVEPAIGRRLLFWCVAAGASAGMFAAGMVGRVVVAGGHPGVQLVQSLAALAAGVATWLAFFPPTALGVASADAADAETMLRSARRG
jgi:hypothetical protein